MKNFISKAITGIILIFIFALIYGFIKDKVIDIFTEEETVKSAYYISDKSLEETLSDSLFTVSEECSVTRVVDGDTIDVDCPSGKNQSVRYLLIDTPEVWKKVSGKWIEDNQCYGKEASKMNKSLVENKKVILISNTLEPKDYYNRKLSHVLINEGKDKNLIVNLFLVGEGFAKFEEYRGVMSFIYEDNAMKKMENIAKENKKGLWGECY
tara:strand:+ start:36 stop:665 length:630 start_codon:yes stop_codon:yes gene_type:complete